MGACLGCLGVAWKICLSGLEACLGGLGGLGPVWGLGPRLEARQDGLEGLERPNLCEGSLEMSLPGLPLVASAILVLLVLPVLPTGKVTRSRNICLDM